MQGSDTLPESRLTQHRPQLPDISIAASPMNGHGISAVSAARPDRRDRR